MSEGMATTQITIDAWPEEFFSLRMDRCREALFRVGLLTYGENNAIIKRIKVAERLRWEELPRQPRVQVLIDGECVADVEVSARHWSDAGPLLQLVKDKPKP